jgi:hypothetical protein
VRGGQRPAEAAVHVGTGKISYYESKNCFEAVCSKHGRVLTRTSRLKRVAGGAMKGGRPCGFLAAWLVDGHGCHRKVEHTDNVRLRALDRDQRLSARSGLEATDAGRKLLSFERALADGEESESLDLSGYVMGV